MLNRFEISSTYLCTLPEFQIDLPCNIIILIKIMFFAIFFIYIKSDTNVLNVPSYACGICITFALLKFNSYLYISSQPAIFPFVFPLAFATVDNLYQPPDNPGFPTYTLSFELSIPKIDTK